MDFQVIENLLKELNEIPEGNIAGRVKHWNKIKTKLDKIEGEIQDIEVVLEADEISDYQESEEEEGDFDIQDNLQKIQQSIDKIKSENLSISEMKTIYIDTIAKIEKCNCEIAETKLSVLKAADTGSLSEVSIH
jgi:Na+/phosphate symporter